MNTKTTPEKHSELWHAEQLAASGSANSAAFVMGYDCGRFDREQRHKYDSRTYPSGCNKRQRHEYMAGYKLGYRNSRPVPLAVPLPNCGV